MLRRISIRMGAGVLPVLCPIWVGSPRSSLGAFRVQSLGLGFGSSLEAFRVQSLGLGFRGLGGNLHRADDFSGARVIETGTGNRVVVTGTDNRPWPMANVANKL